jgi:hypothetical protein
MEKDSHLKLHSWGALFLTLSICVEPLFGTSITVIVIPQGIFLAADGKTTAYIAHKNVPPSGRVSKKLRLFQHRIIVGSYGMAKIGDDPDPAYYLGSFLDSLEKEIGKKSTVSYAAAGIGESATKAMSGISRVLASGTITRETLIQDTGHDNPLAGFVVAGYESGLPKLFRITLDIDWDTKQLRPATITPLFPAETGTPQTNVFLSDTHDPNLLRAWTDCRVPKIGSDIDGTIAMTRAIVEFDIETKGAAVGLPITSVALFPKGGYRIVRFHSRMPNLCETRPKKNKK